MITTSEPRRRSSFTTPLVISLAIHAVVFALLLLFMPRLHEPPKFDELTAMSDAIRLEKRTVVREAVPTEPQPVRPARPVAPPPPRVAERPAPAVVRPVAPRTRPRPAPTARREIAHIVPRAPAAPAPPAVTAPERTGPAPAANPGQPAKNALSPQQLAALDQQFRKTIAQAQVDVAAAPPPTSPPAARRRYRDVMSGTIDQLQTAQGHVEVLQSWSNGEYNYHYVRVSMQYSDGFTELVDVPWPVVFPKSNDPLAKLGGQTFHDLPRPGGYRLPRPFAVSRLVCIFFKDDCQAVFDAEERSRASN